MRDIREFRTKAFLRGAKTALARDGFVTDEHSFAPYRDVVVTKVGEIQEFLTENGAVYDLGTGELKSPEVGPVYFIYDKNRLSAVQASVQVDHWIRKAADRAEA